MASHHQKIFNAHLADEVEMVNDIYGAGTAVIASPTINHTRLELRFPQSADDRCAFVVNVPAKYPKEAPTLVGADLHYTLVSPETSQLEASIMQLLMIEETSKQTAYALLHIIGSFLRIQKLFQEVPEEERGKLSNADNPDIQILKERLSELINAAEAADPKAMHKVRLPLSQCAVCMTTFFGQYMAKLDCNHTFCCHCLRTGANSMLRRDLEFRCCGEWVPTAVIQKFGELPAGQINRYRLLLEEITAAEPIYCHEKTCSAFIPRIRISKDSTSVPCDQCERLTCTSCKGPQHPGKVCPEVESELKDLIAEQKWKPCPGCGNVVERMDGCKSMLCRCGTTFCYNCGQKTRGHYGNCCLNGRIYDTMPEDRPGINLFHAQFLPQARDGANADMPPGADAMVAADAGVWPDERFIRHMREQFEALNREELEALDRVEIDPLDREELEAFGRQEPEALARALDRQMLLNIHDHGQGPNDPAQHPVQHPARPQ